MSKCSTCGTDASGFFFPEDEITLFCDTLRATRPADPSKPVMVAGDPERRNAARRRKDGIPVGANLLDQVREIALASGAPWIMTN